MSVMGKGVTILLLVALAWSASGASVAASVNSTGVAVEVHPQAQPVQVAQAQSNKLEVPKATEVSRVDKRELQENSIQMVNQDEAATTAKSASPLSFQPGGYLPILLATTFLFVACRIY